MRFKNGKPEEEGSEFLDHGWVRLWLMFAAWASISGWGLSLVHNLTAYGYVLSFLLFSLPVFKFWKEMGFGGRSFANPFKLKRWRRPLPLIFLVLFVIILAGGLFYAPNNHDFLAYRFSRILHWWAECGWHWIDSANARMNYSGMGFEWLALPLFGVTGSDRAFFLINLVAFALVPGLFFSVLRDLGLGRRLAWHWMWILPGAYCYVMQAGSVANDAYGVVFLLASIHFFCRSAKPGHLRDFGWGMVAAALLTEIKLVNLPLLVPCLAAAIPAMKPALRKPWRLLLVGIFCLGISGAPSLVANTVYTGHWSGDPFNSDRLQIHNPVSGFLGNSLQLAVQSLVPPILLGEERVSETFLKLIPGSWIGILQRDFPRFSLGLSELPQEESVGVGLGMCILLLFSLCLVLWNWRGSKKADGLWSGQGKWIILGVWGAFLFYMVRMGSECTGRLLCSYYPLLIASILSINGWEALTRRKWWRGLAVLVLASALIPLLLTPSRPLGPAQGILDWIGPNLLNPRQFSRAKQVYEVYRNREDVLAPVRETLPEDARVVGFIGGGDDIEVSLWRPFERRFVVSSMKSPEFPEWVVLNQDGAQKRGFDSVKAWMAHYKYKMVAEIPVATKVRQGAVVWTVARAEFPIAWRNPFDSPRMSAWAAALALGLAFAFSMIFGKKLLLKAETGENQVALGCFQGWIFWVGGMVLSGWFLSAYDGLWWTGGWAVALGGFVLLQIARHWQEAAKEDRREILEWLRYWPWLGLSILILLASALYPPVTLDSLAYRIPRLLFWIQEKGLVYVAGCDPRLNYMTPNWEWTALPFFLAGGNRMLRIPGILSWIVIYLVFCCWAKRLTAARSRVKSCAFLCVASTICVLQAASTVNDLFAAVLLILSAVFIIRFEHAPGFGNIAMSALAFALAAGTKPHFAVMALPWALWFFFSRGRPFLWVKTWKSFLVGPAILICSPLPTFVLNHFYYGSWKGEPEDGFVSGSHWLANLMLGSVMMLWQMVQPPMHPLYNLQNSLTENWIEQFGMREWVARFSLQSKAVAIVDLASFGLVSSLALVVGFWVFFREKNARKKWPFFLAAAGLGGFFLALSQVVPWTVGRSFSGFVFLLFPAALVGFGALSPRSIRILTLLAFASCAFSLIFSASHPLWPAKTVARWVEKSGNDSTFGRMVKQSADFAGRADTASDLVKEIPESEEQILAVVALDRPLLSLWQPYYLHRKVITFNKGVTVRDLMARPGRYLLTSSGLEEYYPGLTAELETGKAFLEIDSREYLSSLGRGPEVWKLWKKIDPESSSVKRQ